MATSEDIATLRRLINEPTDVAPWTDAVLSGIIDSSGSVNKAAGSIWTEKAASYADLVDVQEGSSRRALGDLYEQAIAMAKHFGAVDLDEDGEPTKRRSRTRAIVRP